MTTNDAAAIERRLAAATPGPWFWVEPHGVVHRIVDDPRLAHVEVAVAAIEGLFSRRHANGDFIAHAPTDIAALLADNAALSGECVRRGGEIVRLRAALKLAATTIEWTQGFVTPHEPNAMATWHRGVDGPLATARAALREGTVGE